MSASASACGLRTSATLAVAALWLAACGDPYETKLPSDARLTAGQVDKIAGKLPAADEQAFRRWAERMNQGNDFGGEPTAATVRRALINQQEFERLHAAEQAERLRREEQQRLAREAADRDAAQAEEAEAKRAAEEQQRRLIVNAAIRERFDGKVIRFTPQTQYDRYDRPVKGFISFDVQFKNRGTKPVAGGAGLVNIKDVFGTDLGWYDFVHEVDVRPGSTVTTTFHLNFDPRNERHRILWSAKQLFAEWFFVSVAYQDGTRIDYDAVQAWQEEKRQRKSDQPVSESHLPAEGPRALAEYRPGLLLAGVAPSSSPPFTEPTSAFRSSR